MVHIPWSMNYISSVSGFSIIHIPSLATGQTAIRYTSRNRISNMNTSLCTSISVSVPASLREQLTSTANTKSLPPIKK